MNLAPLRRRVRKAGRRLRGTRMLIRTFKFAYQPVARGGPKARHHDRLVILTAPETECGGAEERAQSE